QCEYHDHLLCPAPSFPRYLALDVILSSIDPHRLRYETTIPYARSSNHREHLHDPGVRHPTVGPQIHPCGPFRSDKGGERGPEIVVGEPGLIEIDLAIGVHGHDESLLRLDGAHLRARQPHLDSALHDGRAA